MDKEQKSSRIWVVEMLCDNGKFEPTVGVALDRKSGRDELKKWRGRCHGKFRLVPYYAGRGS